MKGNQIKEYMEEHQIPYFKGNIDKEYTKPRSLQKSQTMRLIQITDKPTLLQKKIYSYILSFISFELEKLRKQKIKPARIYDLNLDAISIKKICGIRNNRDYQDHLERISKCSVRYKVFSKNKMKELVGSFQMLASHQFENNKTVLRVSFPPQIEDIILSGGYYVYADFSAFAAYKNPMSFELHYNVLQDIQEFNGHHIYELNEFKELMNVEGSGYRSDNFKRNLLKAVKEINEHSTLYILEPRFIKEKQKITHVEIIANIDQNKISKYENQILGNESYSIQNIKFDTLLFIIKHMKMDFTKNTVKWLLHCWHESQRSYEVTGQALEYLRKNRDFSFRLFFLEQYEIYCNGRSRRNVIHRLIEMITKGEELAKKNHDIKMNYEFKRNMYSVLLTEIEEELAEEEAKIKAKEEKLEEEQKKKLSERKKSKEVDIFGIEKEDMSQYY
jgi:replication initiator protein